MSFIHRTFVGHFDPTTLFPDRPLRPLRPLDKRLVDIVLSEEPLAVQDCVEYVGGYVVVEWSACRGDLMERASEFGCRLAERTQCIAAESPVYQIVYPEAARQAQQIAGKALMATRPPRPPPVPVSPSIWSINCPGPSPCPYCGELLRTGLAKQCRHCRMDWHDPANIYRRGADGSPTVAG
jgi:hypothetical protein